MMWGFDLGQIDLREDQVALMADVLDYFGLVPGLNVEINEGDRIEIQNVDIVDPAEGVVTEQFHFWIDWGDGETGPLTNVTGTGGVNVQVTNTEPTLVVPNDHATVDGSSQNTIPLGPGFGSRRYQQYYDASQMGGTRRDIDAIGFRISGTHSVTYNNLKIYLSHTTSSGLDRYFANNYGTDRTLVLSRTSYTYTKTTYPADFTMITFDKMFKYDGNSNLVLEIVYTSGTNIKKYWDADRDSSLHRLWASSPTSTYGSQDSDRYGLVTKFSFKNIETPESPLPWESYMHTYRDDPCDGDIYEGLIHVYDDDLGHSTLPFKVKVNNVIPEFDPLYVMPKLIADESGSENILLPSIPFTDPGTQSNKCSEAWTVWWDLDNDGKMHNSPDEIYIVPASMVTEKDNRSFGMTPRISACVNDDYLFKPIAVYILDDDMAFDLSSRPSQITSTITINNKAPVASLEAYVPMEVRVRLTGREHNDLKVLIKQTNPNDPRDIIVDELMIERMPGEPKDNPFQDGTPSEPLLVKAIPDRKIELVVAYSAIPDANDPVHPQGKPHGSSYACVFLDFPMEDDYDPRDDDQSDQGHHWTASMWFNGAQVPLDIRTFDVTSELKDKKGVVIGSSYDDSSDDAQFNWVVLSGSMQLPYTTITYYNDGSDPVVNGAFSDDYPSPWTGSAPVTYEDIHEFVYTGGFSLALYTVDDDGGRSKTVTLSLT
jgi:hypothetical protein